MGVNFPKHKCGLYLTHNEHRDSYETAEGWIIQREIQDDEWVGPEEKSKAIETDEIWALQWYPDTPVGFHVLYASSLDALLKAATAP